MRRRKSMFAILLCCVMLISMGSVTYAQDTADIQSLGYQLSLPGEFDYNVTYGEIKNEVDAYIAARGMNLEINTEEYTDLMYQILYGSLDDVDSATADYFSAYAALYINRGDVEQYVDTTLGEIRDENLASEAEARALVTPQPRVAYNLTKAQNYAYTHWQVYNPAFPSFSSDCTNFASQILNAGGFPFSNDWNCFASTSSSAYVNWVRASNFAQYWALVRGYVGAGCSTVAQVNANANPGDFLAYMNGSTFEIWHIAFVHSKANGKISISQHTTNRYNQVWNNVIESDFMSKNSVNIIKFS